MYQDNQIGLLQRKLFSILSRKFIFIGFSILIFILLIGVGLDKSQYYTSPITNKSKLLSLSSTLPQSQSSNDSSLNNSSDSTPQIISNYTSNNSVSVDQSATSNNVQSSGTIDTDTTTTSTGTSPSKESMTNNVVINGKNVQVSPDTDYSKTVISPNSVTSLNVSNQANQSGTSSSINVQIDSQSVNSNTTSESE